MIDINESDFRRLDLNLLLVFTALLRERSVTKAAQRLHVGQPALSASLARLREFFGDELFVRGATGMEPTARAEQLGQALKPLLEGLGPALLEPPAFVPAESERSFTLGMTDILELALAPGLLALLAKEAPGVRLSLRAADQYDAPARLDAGELDLAIGNIEAAATRQRLLKLYDEQFLCLYDPRHVRASRPITLDEFVAVPHLLTSFRGSFTGFVDTALAAVGSERRVVFVTSRFGTVPWVLGALGAIATLPATVAHLLAEQLGLAVSPPPLELPEPPIAMLWHARLQDDPGHAWMRERVRQVLLEAKAKTASLW